VTEQLAGDHAITEKNATDAIFGEPLSPVIGPYQLKRAVALLPTPERVRQQQVRVAVC
jgi:hypothetical protein